MILFFIALSSGCRKDTRSPSPELSRASVSASPPAALSVSSVPPNLAAASYVLPSNFFLHATSHRQSDGGITIEGDTNLPEGMKMWVIVHVRKRTAAQDTNVFVTSGHVYTTSLWDDIYRPREIFPAGKYRVEFLSIFNRGWQTPEILNLVGEGARNSISRS
jgi:hypothetical protein